MLDPILAQSSDPAPSADSPAILYFWIILGSICLIATALFSGNEIGIYSLSRVRLRLRTARGEPNAILINQWLQKPTYPIEGLLILQNLFGFFFSASVTAILSYYHFQEFSQALISILIVTPILLIFADIVPKDLFHANADQWTYRMAPLMRWHFAILTVIPLLPIVHAMGRASARLLGMSRAESAIPAGPRAEIMALFQESVATGVLSGTQQDLIQRALRLARTTVQETMIPWNRVVGVPASISRDGFKALVARYNVTRMPVLGKSPNEVLGVVDVIDALASLTPPPASPTATPPQQPTPPATPPFQLSQHIRPAMTLLGEQPVRSAITLMQLARQTLAVVVDRQNKAVGLVTMKDLVEELIGDLENW